MVKLFSHQSDPDGIGCVILASLVFKDLDFTLCKNVDELNLELENFLNQKEYQNYEQVFITDLCPSDEIASQIKNLTTNILVFDHHISSIKNLTQNYPFLFVTEEIESVPTCGTELFYFFLIKFLPVRTPFIDSFVELTRLHDTWEWKKENRLDAFHLQILLQYLGAYGYVYHLFERCKNEKGEFSYTTEEQKWIAKQERLNREGLEFLVEHLIFKEQEGYISAAQIGEYDYRNLIAEEIKKRKLNADVLVFFAYDNKTVSFRSVRNMEVASLAESFGGVGHPGAASCSITLENEQKLIRKFLA